MSHIQNTNWWMSAAPQVQDVWITTWSPQEPTPTARNPESVTVDADIRVDPQTHSETKCVDFVQHPLGIGKYVWVPLQVRPATELLPEAVQVQHGGRNVSVTQLSRTRDGGFGAVCLEPGGYPQAEGPFWWAGRPADQIRVAPNDRQRLARDHVVVECIFGHDQAERGV